MAQSRARALAAALSASLAVAVAGAGMLGSAAAAAASSSGPLTLSIISTGTSKIPAFTSTGEDIQIMNQIYGSLLAFKPGSSALEPSLATSYQVSDGARVWTFNLRHGVKWQGGYGLFTCKDVQFTWNFNKNPKNGSLWQANADVVSSVSCPTPYKAVFHLVAPNTDFGLAVANVEPLTGYIMSAAAWAKLGKAGYDKTPIGTGPYELKSLVPNVSITLVRNPTYWGPAAHVATVEFKVVTDLSTAALAVENGSLDIAAINPITAAEFAHSRTAHILVKRAIFPSFLEINTTVPPFNNVLVRRAMRYAIDYAAIKQDVFRGDSGPVTQGVVLPGQIGYNAKYDPPNVYNPAKAKALLKQAHVKLPIKGFFTTYNDTTDVSVAQLIQEDLSQVGIDLQARPLERGTLDVVRIKSSTPATILSAPETPDPNLLLTFNLLSSEDPPTGLDTARYAGIDKLYTEQLDAPTTAARVRVLWKIEQRLTADVPIIIVDNSEDVWIVNNKVHNYFPTTQFSGDPLNLVSLSG